MLRLKRILDGSPIGVKGYAKLLDLSAKGLYNKLSGATVFTYPEYNIDYLLTAEQDSA